MPEEAKPNTVTFNVGLVLAGATVGAIALNFLNPIFRFGYRVEQLEREITKVEGLSTSVASLKSDFDTFRVRINGDVDGLKDRTSEMSAKLSVVQSGIDDLKSLNYSLTERFKNWQNDVDRAIDKAK